MKFYIQLIFAFVLLSYNVLAQSQFIPHVISGGGFEITNPSSVYACDMDSDNDIDVISASSTWWAKFAWYENNGSDCTTHKTRKTKSFRKLGVL